MPPDHPFRVDPAFVVEVDGRKQPDAQARYEYEKHFGKLDMKDLMRRYREAQREADRRARQTDPVPQPPAPKRPLVQSTLKGWTKAPCNA